MLAFANIGAYAYTSIDTHNIRSVLKGQLTRLEAASNEKMQGFLGDLKLVAESTNANEQTLRANDEDLSILIQKQYRQNFFVRVETEFQQGEIDELKRIIGQDLQLFANTISTLTKMSQSEVMVTQVVTNN